MANPIYHKNWPEFKADDWSTDFDLGWISNLYKTSIKALPKIYGNYSEFKLNDDNVLDLDELDPELFVDASVGPIIYLSVWVAIMVLFGVVGFCWCLCNRCCCCCRSSFKGRSGRSIDELENTDPRYQLRPHYYSERNDKSGGISLTAIILSVLMAVWLVGFLIIILHTFAANGKTKEAVENIQPDIDSILDNMINFTGTAQKQLSHTFGGGVNIFAQRVDKIIDDALPPNFPPEPVQPIRDALQETKTLIEDSSAKLEEDLNDVQKAIEDGREQLVENYEDSINNANKYLYWFFLIFNLLYCLVFILVLFGTVFAGFSRGNAMKTSGFLLIRGGIVIMFIVAILVILQLATMFIVSGVSSEIVCPAVRELENEPVLKSKQSEPGKYEIPGFGTILRACKKDETAYDAFDLHESFQLDELDKITEAFNNIGSGLPSEIPISEIRQEADAYVDYVKHVLKNEMGKCYPVYLAVNTTLNLFCHKLTAPVASYWYILQFIPLIFVLIFFTAMFFERLHS